MEALIKEFFTVYGPLSMGWIALWFQWKENVSMRKELTQAYIDHAKVFSDMGHALDGLTQVVKGK